MPGSVEELASLSGEPAERLRAWEALGLLRRDGRGYRRDTLERIRLIGYAAKRGVAAESIAAASAEQGDVLARYLRPPGAAYRASRPVPDAAAEAGLDVSFVRRLTVAAGLSDQAELDGDDLEMLRVLTVALDTGMPAEALLQLVRVYNDALSRVAEAESLLFRFYVRERLKAFGVTGGDLMAATESARAPLRELIGPTVMYFHDKALRRALRDDLVAHLGGEAGTAGHAIGRTEVTVLFADLADFTIMTEVMGDAMAAAVVDRFSELVREAAAGCGGRVLKQIGDEFMLAFTGTDGAGGAVRCGLAIIASAAVQAQFPGVRLGAHAGTALYRDGDYLGATVNIAARVSSQAAPGQLLVTGAVRTAAGEEAEAWFEAVGPRSLKNIAEPVELFEARSRRRVLSPGKSWLVPRAS